MAKLTNTQLRQRGTATMAEAKRIRQQHPELPWRECVARAGKKIKTK